MYLLEVNPVFIMKLSVNSKTWKYKQIFKANHFGLQKFSSHRFFDSVAFVWI